ncbi:MAG: flagellar hook-length control protein FliK [Lachnospiraceae bacterium]|nr:flagellar hook-length control protein FliK [Lachnospiraceae bacterium]
MIGAPINELTSTYASFMGAGKPNGNGKGEGDGSFADLMNSVSEGVDVVKELTPVSKQDATGMGADTNKENVDYTSAKKTELKESSSRETTDAKSTKTENVKTQSEKTVVDEKETVSADTKENASEEIPSETLETVMSSMVTTLMEVLNVSEEEIQSVLDEMDIQVSDLLNPETLKEFVLGLKADGDASALLTDENLLGSLKELEGDFQDIVDTVAKELDLPVEEVKAALVSGKEKPMEDFVNVGETVPENVTSQNVPVKEARQLEDNKAAAVEESEITSTTENPSSVTQVPVKTEDAPKKEDREFDHKQQSQEGMQFTQQTEVSADYKSEAVETPVSSMLSENAREIFEQVRDQIRANTNDGLTELQMKLNPENLGNVHLTLTAREGAVTAHFGTENDAVRQALEMQIAQLKENLEHQGVKVEAVEVTVSSHGFEQNLEQGNEQNLTEEKEREALRKATRKINLLGDEEGVEELDEAEAVTVDMMKADGNSMDYKA